jgi:hypothetical protein
MEKYPLPKGGVGHSTNIGQLAVWTPGQGFLVARLAGYGEAEFAGPILDALEKILLTKRVVRLFFDAEQLHGYDSQLRTTLTEQFRNERSKIEVFRVLSRSRLVGLGISVANLALSGLVTVHSKRAEFFGELDAALGAAGVAEFSSNVLDGLRRGASFVARG